MFFFIYWLQKLVNLELNFSSVSERTFQIDTITEWKIWYKIGLFTSWGYLDYKLIRPPQED